MKKSIIQSNAPIRTIRAVCVDTLSLRNVETPWGKKNQVKLVFETEELKGNGYPRTASRTLNISYYEKGTLRKVLEPWLGRSLSASEMLNGFPFDRLVGKAAEIDVQDAQTDEGTPFLRIVSIRPGTAKPLVPSGSSKRYEDSAVPTKRSRPAPESTGLNEPVTVCNQEAELEAQFERHAASSEEAESPEPPTLPDNADTVVVNAGN